MHSKDLLLLCLLLSVAVLRQASTGVIRNSRQAWSSDSNLQAYMVPVANEFNRCGHGCISFKIDDILKEVDSMSKIRSATLRFYEHGNLTDWQTFKSSNQMYEVYTIDSHGLRNRNISTFTIRTEGFYKSGWRSVNILPDIMDWLKRTPRTKVITAIFRKVGDNDTRNERFAVQKWAQPFIMLGSNPSSDRVKRDLDFRITRNCSSNSSEQACCVKSLAIDLNKHKEHTLNWWLSPRTFEMKFCVGMCEAPTSYYYEVLRLYNNSQGSCCRPYEYEPFPITYTDDNGTHTYDLMKFKVKSCVCV